MKLYDQKTAVEFAKEYSKSFNMKSNEKTQWE